MALPAVASGHLERPSYWPDPTPDTSISPAAGGKVPKARSLASAVTGAGPGNVRVVCKDDSLRVSRQSIAYVRDHGYRLRPSQPKERLSAAKADRLLEINRALAEMCSYGSIQPALDASGNNDRIVIMPGRYTEPKSRRAPVNDPKCNPSMLQESQRGAKTPSYEYQAKCPNDQNLIFVQGRAVKGGVPGGEPDPDRHGIPEEQLGRCVRCNLQIEGSGVRPEDVLLDAGRGYKKPEVPGNRPGSEGTSPEDCLAAPDGQDNPCYAKHVVLRADRTDGFVGKNFLLRGAKEHGFYTEESDGVLLDRVKFFWNADYGHLSFTSDHSVIKNCDGFGSGDAVVYPGAAPQTGEFRDESFYPKERFNTVIKRCDLHGSAMGYSGSMGNSVRVTRNHFYGNANGLTSDSLSSAGHPGFPGDGQKIDHNWFYSNNLDIYRDDAPFVPL
ncbi:MAG: right-handed parallel beta-helix repeat-containing protein, partial [Actinomycetota bacterium]|nr:right-handed parallel beta-helix repeat-containing protein [Actinomycetota bacterium]